MNIECTQQSHDELIDAFRFNDAVLRNLVIKRRDAVTETSLLAKSKDEDDERDARRAAQNAENAKAAANDEESKPAEAPVETAAEATATTEES